MKFSDYHISKEVKQNLKDMGFTRPTDIQFKAIPPILAGEDVMAIAQTGTGKTAAFAIPIINKLQNLPATEDIKCLVMVPTRELALQILEVFEKIGKNTSVKAACLVGGVDQDQQIAQINNGASVLIATPGRMFDLIYQKEIKITKVEILILDEADHMLDLGFNKDIQDVLKFIPKKHQTLFFSATISKKIKDLAYALVRNAIRIQISPKNPVAKSVTHSVAFIEMDDKRFFLERTIKENPESRIIVFVRTQIRAERVSKALDRVGIASGVMHGGRDQKDRIEVLSKFRTSEIKILITTDVSARGIDIPNVDMVVNYDLPEQAENYVHRVGRTGRGTSLGYAVSYCSSEEKELLNEIEEYIGREVTVLAINNKDYEQTIDFSEAGSDDWKSLIKEAEQDVNHQKKKPGKGKK